MSDEASVSYPPIAMLDGLTAERKYYMFNMVNPAYKSHAGKHLDSTFRNKQRTAPMVYSPEAGLVMYERVVVGQQETQMLNKLSKPKNPRPPVAANKPSKAQAKLQGAQMPGAPAHGQQVDRSAASAPSMSAAAASGVGSRSGSPAGVGAAAGGAEARGASPSGNNRDRSASATASGAAGTVGAAAVADPRSSSKYGISAALKPSREEQEMQKYVNRERAVMTASHVFTWGGRIKYSGPENGLSRQTWATGLSKPPLRL